MAEVAIPLIALGSLYIMSNQNRKEEQKAAWLAMYTYNPVEGAYFDDNPSGYLGAY